MGRVGTAGGEFSFAPADERLLRKGGLAAEVVADLARALSARFGGSAEFAFPGERRLLTRIEALLSEADRQGGALPPEVRRWLEGRAWVARQNVATLRKQRRRTRSMADFRALFEGLTLRVMTRHGLKTGGPVAARVLAIVLHARCQIPIGNEEGQLQALQRARRRLRAFDPIEPACHPSGRVSSELEEWADEALRPVTSMRGGPRNKGRR